MLTIIRNRVGDIFILLSLGYLLISYGLSYFLIRDYFFSSFICVMLVLAAFTRSAQMPFSAWLPAAMAAPTPVSSLVHSSTLVTAGVYLLIRYDCLLGLGVRGFVVWVSLLTSLMAGASALYEVDIKRIIALSTLRQLGLMMFSLGVGSRIFCYYHLLVHALFRALLFLCAGCFIHCVLDIQDGRLMGSLGSGLTFSSVGFG